jgi:hypothetical protein
VADRHRAPCAALGRGRRSRDRGGSRASSCAALDLESSLPNSCAERPYRCFLPRAHSSWAGRAYSRVSTGGLDPGGGRAALGDTEQRPRPSPAASYSLIRNPDCSVVARSTRSRISHKFRLGFSNASLDHPWRTALVHSVEYGAVRSSDLVSSFAVRHARLDASRQAHDVEELLKSGVDGLIVSAHDSISLLTILRKPNGKACPSC